ncbi:MAG: alpha-amylase, partial [Dehalococcoidia bacterium]|nr:alpha-amylase [Dehalococcoidia bacterium]
KRSPLRDVADMLWSFYEASHTALAGQGAGLLIRTEDSAYLRPWARFWHLWVSVSFMKSYLATASGSPILPQAQEDIQILLDIHLLEKAFYELNSELRNHPDRVIVAIRGILELMDAVN